jgi:hypothetical protein
VTWRSAYRAYYRACLTATTPEDFAGQAYWDALPLWLRVRLSLRCHWVDAVYEVSPLLGRLLVAVRTRFLRRIS